MIILLNGEPSDASTARTVEELVQVLNLPAPAILIEHNGLALLRHEWPGKTLAEGDQIEFIRVVAGG